MLHFPSAGSRFYCFLAGSLFAFIFSFTLPVARAQQQPQPLAPLQSPNKKITLDFQLNAGSPTYTIRVDNQIILNPSRLGLVRDDEDFSKNLTLQSASTPDLIEDHYEILTIKRRLNTYRANRQTFHLLNANNKPIDLTFQVSDDGVAFRYTFPDASTTLHKLTRELTSFHLLPNSKAWLQPMQVAKSGYANSNPAYEEYYQKEIDAGTPSTLGAGWVFPALFRSGDTWLLLSETNLHRNYCATHLAHESPDAEYSIAFADPRETINDGPTAPQSTLPWTTPWRIVAVGSLKTIAESTLGTDLADAPAQPADPTIKPGKASWSWALLGDRSMTYDIQKRFIDYAADMHWSYCLIDAFWDTHIGYDKMKELADYAAAKNVGILLWYNSGGNWNDTQQTPKDKMLTHESRIAEFTKLKAIGIKGVKIDFFPGDGQSSIAYYHDILEDAAPFGLLMNFHGATLPRGWERTYPHLMSMEAIKGFEFTKGSQENADEEPMHAAMLPFTRNLFDPMDFTPVCLDHITGNRVKRRTTSTFELALSVIFTSGIQHYVEIPEGMAKMPDYIKSFMQNVPSIWDDTQFIDGYPGQFVVLARKGNNHWYVAGINATPREKTLKLNLASLPVEGRGTLILDAPAPALFTQHPFLLPADKSLELTLPPAGGFVLEFQ